jgi:hypothetical protein
VRRAAQGPVRRAPASWERAEDLGRGLAVGRPDDPARVSFDEEAIPMGPMGAARDRHRERRVPPGVGRVRPGGGGRHRPEHVVGEVPAGDGVRVSACRRPSGNRHRRESAGLRASGRTVEARLRPLWAADGAGRIGGRGGGARREARVPAALVWAAIVRSHERGDRWLDFGGISRPAAVALTEGRWDSPDVRTKHGFKLAFGGRPCLCRPPVELVRDPAFRAGLRVARSVRPTRRSMRRALGRVRMGTPWRRVGP